MSKRERKMSSNFFSAIRIGIGVLLIAQAANVAADISHTVPENAMVTLCTQADLQAYGAINDILAINGSSSNAVDVELVCSTHRTKMASGSNCADVETAQQLSALCAN